ncbi:MAG: SDR family NAD(P)-dependent oxidoreductase [Propionibacteriales bacterium]|nr:SDR family NAD(P)-dependent oxidoreductase [Propionibacteriales bacterium]
MTLPTVVTSVLDSALDRAVLPGYSRIGPLLRRNWWPDDPEPDALRGKRVVVTGASSGLGTATAADLARLGATVHLVGRKQSRLREAAALISEDVPEAVLVVDECDVSDLDAVRAYAADLTERLGSLDGLVHDAGVLPPERSTSAQGHELAFATHILGPFLLTVLLRDLLATADDARVVWVSSGGMYTRPFTHELATDLEYEHGDYSGPIAYARTKRMQVIVAEQLAERFASHGVVVHSMHPGWAATPGITDSLPRFAKLIGPVLRTPAEGADTIVWLMASTEAVATTGQFWCDRRPRATSYLPWRKDSAADRQLLWDYCCTVTGVTEMTTDMTGS